MLELSNLDLERSIARASSLARQFQLTEMETEIVVKYFAFFAYLQFGSNFISQYMFLDTGSTLLWIHCKPSENVVPRPLFNPKQSSTFRREYCNRTDICKFSSTVNILCGSRGGCNYEVRYVKGESKGVLGRDIVRFGRDILEDVVFGCSSKTDVQYSSEFGNGVLGLRPARLSFMGQMEASRFGYCIGNISDIHNDYNKLFIGDDIILLGDMTRLYVEAHYIISVEAISFGGNKLNISPKILRRDPEDSKGGVVLDSGSTYTFFPEVVVDKIVDELYWVMDPHTTIHGYIRRGIGGNYELKCYRGVISDVRDFPNVHLWLSLGAVMKLTAENMFYQYDSTTFCLAIIPSEYIGGETFVLGNIMQQYFHFVFDLQYRRLAIKRMDCARLYF